MDFFFTGKIEEKKIPYIKKTAQMLINNKPNIAIKVKYINY